MMRRPRSPGRWRRQASSPTPADEVSITRQLRQRPSESLSIMYSPRQSVAWRGVSLRCPFSIRLPFSPLRLVSVETSLSCNRTFRYIYRVTRSMSLQQLEQFVAVAEERHFTRAALRCHIAQSALSTSIRSLEARIGRSTLHPLNPAGRAQPTGRALLPEARRVLAAADSARDAVAQTLRGVQGEPHQVGSVWGDVCEVLAAYHALFPDVKVTLKRGLSLRPDQGRALRRG